MNSRVCAASSSVIATTALAVIFFMLGSRQALAQFGAGDIVVGVSLGEDTFRVYDASEDTWSNGPGWERAFIQSVEFDNSNGISHNANGNLLGANFGNSFTGFELFNFATNGTNASESLWSIVEATGGTKGTNPMGAWLSQRGGGVSVSPGNDYVAWTNFDTAEIFVHDYDPGPNPGSGAGAMISGPRRTGPGNGMGGEGTLNALANSTTQGSTWLDDTTLAAFNAFGEVITLDVAGVAGGAEDGTLAGWMPTVMTNWEVANSEVAFTAQTTDIEYNPMVDPDHIYASATIAGSFETQLIAYDYNPSTGAISLNRSITFANAMNEEREPREIALAANGDLYFSGYAGGGLENSNNLVLRLPSATNVAGWDAANIEVFHNTQINQSFTAIDVAVGEEAAVQMGDFSGNGSVENADLTLLLDNWGQPVPPVPAGWVGDQPTPPAIDNDELTKLLDNWGAGDGAAVAAGVPEPASVILVGLVLAALVCRRRGA